MRVPRNLPPAGWWAAAALGALTTGVLGLAAVPPTTALIFAAYVAGAIVLPGTLLWRALRGGPGLLAVDLSGGTAVGYALEVLGYLPARAADRPYLAVLLPAVVLATFLLRPGLRRYWRGSGQRVPAWWAWTLAAVLAALLLLSAATFYRAHALHGPGSLNPNIDVPFHLALAGELKHHLPPTVPYLRGEPLRYHWFVYADLAASSWFTGIELRTLLLRLSLLPMLATYAVAVAVAAGELVNRRAGRPAERGTAWWPGPPAAALALFAVAPAPYPWRSTALPTEGNLLDGTWLSPTQAFGAVFAVPVLLVLTELIRRPAAAAGAAPVRSTGRWLLLGVLLLALAGAKATFLPMLLAALLLVTAGGWLAARGLNRPAALAAAMVGAVLALAHLVLFRGTSAGLVLAPLDTVRRTGISLATGLATGPPATGPPATGPPATGPWESWSAAAPLAVAAGVALLLCVLGWAVMWAGAAGVGLGAPARSDPGVLLNLGMGGAGVGAALTFGHGSASQLYFFWSARASLALLVVAGLAVLVERRGAIGRWLAGAGAGAAGCAVALRAFGASDVPDRRTAGGGAGLAATLLWPYLLLLVLAVGVALVARRRGGSGALGAVVVLTGFGLPAMVAGVAGPVRAAVAGVPVSRAPVTPALPVGALSAGRWLRDHSGPGDVVATNVHCRPPAATRCDNRHFWVSASTERRLLVEGWGYTSTVHAIAIDTGHWYVHVPFWDAGRLTDNDRAFSAPSAATTGVLRHRYGVRWLFVDRRYRPPDPALGRYAVLRHRAGDCEVYELTGSAS